MGEENTVNTGNLNIQPDSDNRSAKNENTRKKGKGEDGKPQGEQDINQLLKIRREKLAALQDAGEDPFLITK